MDESVQEYQTLLAGNSAKAEKQLYKLAKKGNLQALSVLNEYYEKCVTEAKTSKESSKIRQKALKAALLGAADGIVKVGRAYMNGIGVPADYQKSMYYFEKAAEEDHAEAMVLTAYQYENGKGVKVDYEKALEWLARAQCSCRLRLEGELSEKDRNYYESLLQDVDRQRSHCESAACMELIGREDCPMERRQQAFSRLSELAHEKGDLRAQVSMGILYEEGTFVGQDEHKALEYYLMAAQNGSTGAMNNIGNFFLHGKGVEKDYDKAFAWYQKAAELSGNAAAQCSLGMCYQYGYGTKVDYEKARCFYALSAKQGLGVAKDVRMAKQYFGEAMDRGYREAALKL